MLALLNLYLHNRMADTQTPTELPAPTGEPVTPSTVYQEVARTADRELREWIRRRAEQRAHNRQTRRLAERGSTPN